MVESTNKSVTIKLVLESDPDIYTQVQIPRDLEPPCKMTALLYARDHLLETIQLKNYALIFGDDLKTDEEKILRQGITVASVRPKAMADQVYMKTGDEITEKTSLFVVDKPKSLFKISMVEMNG